MRQFNYDKRPRDRMFGGKPLPAHREIVEGKTNWAKFFENLIASGSDSEIIKEIRDHFEEFSDLNETTRNALDKRVGAKLKFPPSKKIKIENKEFDESEIDSFINSIYLNRVTPSSMSPQLNDQVEIVKGICKDETLYYRLKERYEKQDREYQLTPTRSKTVLQDICPNKTIRGLKRFLGNTLLVNEKK